MTITQKIDFVPLVQRLIDKSVSGKIKWEPTANRTAFVVSFGGNLTFKILTVTVSGINEWGDEVNYEEPRLDILDEKGMTLWNVYKRDVPDNMLWELYNVARRIGNRVDMILEGAISILEKL